MPRALFIPVNMLPYMRFQQMALLNGKYSNWHEPVFRTGSCHSENLHTMPEGIYKRAIVTGCFQFDQLHLLNFHHYLNASYYLIFFFKINQH